MMKSLWNILSKLFIPKRFLVAAMLCTAAITFAPSEVRAESCPTMQVLKDRYQSSCFPCQIVQVLVSAFMGAADKVYDTSKDAGKKLLLLGSIIWLVFWALKKLSSLTNPEPMAMANELLIFLGKLVLAICFLTAGTSALVSYTVNPILSAGADYGVALMLKSETLDVTSDPLPENSYKGPTNIISPVVMNKILKFSESASNEVATNLIIGNALTCFAIENGFHWNLFIKFTLPDVWLLLCGIIIWCIGFMLTLSICYYLIDIPFKLGFAIIALPVVIGLWPFKMTSGKLKSCIDIIFNAAGTFLFLALSCSYAMLLISESMNIGDGIKVDGAILTGKDALMHAMEKDNVKYVQRIFAITGPYFLILIFCYIYAIKIISEVTNKFPSKFFGSGMTAGASPMHQMATGATNWLGKKAMAPLKKAGEIFANQAGKAATTVVKAAGNTALGGASALTGAAVNKLAKGAKWTGNKLASQSRQAKEGLDAQQQLNDRLQGRGSPLSTLANRSQAMGAGLMAKVGDKIASSGDVMNKHGEAMKQPWKNTTGRISNTFKASANEIKEAIKNRAPDTAQNHLAQASVSRDKFEQSSKKLATYVPSAVGEKMQVAGAYYNAQAQNTGGVQSQLSARLGNLLSKTGEKVVDNKAAEGTLRHKIMSIQAQNLKTVFSGQAVRQKFSDAKDGMKAGIAKGWQNTKDATYKAGIDAAKDIGDEFKMQRNLASRDAKGLKKRFKNSVSDTFAQIKDGGKDLRSSFGQLKRDGSFHGMKGNWKSDVANATGELAKSTKELGNTAFVNEPKNAFKGTTEGLKSMGQAYQNAYGYDKEKGFSPSIGGVIKTVAATPLIIGHALKEGGEGLVDSTYNVAEKSMMATIDLAKTAIAASPLYTVGRLSRDVAGMAVDASKIVSAPIGTTVNLIADGLTTAHSGIKTITRPTAMVAGKVLNAAIVMPIGFTAKMVDEGLYQTAKAVERSVKTVARPFNVAGQTVRYGLESKYHELAATSAGQTISKTLHRGGATLKVGIGVLKMGRNIIKAAAGEGGKGMDDIDKSIEKEERKKREKEAQIEKKKREQKEKAAREREKEKLREKKREEERREERRKREEEAERLEQEREERERQREEERRQREEEDANN